MEMGLREVGIVPGDGLNDEFLVTLTELFLNLVNVTELLGRRFDPHDASGLVVIDREIDEPIRPFLDIPHALSESREQSFANLSEEGSIKRWCDLAKSNAVDLLGGVTSDE
jgi:hypothetical protein